MIPKRIAEYENESFVSSIDFDFTKSPDLQSPPERRKTKYLGRMKSCSSSLKRIGRKTFVRTPMEKDRFMRLFDDNTKENLFDSTLVSPTAGYPAIHIVKATPESCKRRRFSQNSSKVSPQNMKHRTSTPYTKESFLAQFGRSDFVRFDETCRSDVGYSRSDNVKSNEHRRKETAQSAARQYSTPSFNDSTSLWSIHDQSPADIKQNSKPNLTSTPHGNWSNRRRHSDASQFFLTPIFRSAQGDTLNSTAPLWTINDELSSGGRLVPANEQIYVDSGDSGNEDSDDVTVQENQIYISGVGGKKSFYLRPISEASTQTDCSINSDNLPASLMTTFMDVFKYRPW